MSSKITKPDNPITWTYTEPKTSNTTEYSLDTSTHILTITDSKENQVTKLNLSNAVYVYYVNNEQPLTYIDDCKTGNNLELNATSIIRIGLKRMYLYAISNTAETDRKKILEETYKKANSMTLYKEIINFLLKNHKDNNIKDKPDSIKNEVSNNYRNKVITYENEIANNNGKQVPDPNKIKVTTIQSFYEVYLLSESSLEFQTLPYSSNFANYSAWFGASLGLYCYADADMNEYNEINPNDKRNPSVQTQIRKIAGYKHPILYWILQRALLIPGSIVGIIYVIGVFLSIF